MVWERCGTDFVKKITLDTDQTVFTLFFSPRKNVMEVFLSSNETNESIPLFRYICESAEQAELFFVNFTKKAAFEAYSGLGYIKYPGLNTIFYIPVRLLEYRGTLNSLMSVQCPFDVTQVESIEYPDEDYSDDVPGPISVHVSSLDINTFGVKLTLTI